MRDPLMTSVHLIRHAIADQFRDLGGDDQNSTVWRRPRPKPCGSRRAEMSSG